jgi:hypothetical protein
MAYTMGVDQRLSRKAIEVMTMTGHAESGLDALCCLRMDGQHIPLAPFQVISAQFLMIVSRSAP